MLQLNFVIVRHSISDKVIFFFTNRSICAFHNKCLLKFLHMPQIQSNCPNTVHQHLKKDFEMFHAKFLQNQTLHRNMYLFLNIRCKDCLRASKIHLRSNLPNPSIPIHFLPRTIFFLYSINEVFHFPVFLFFTTITKYPLFWLFSSCFTM